MRATIDRLRSGASVTLANESIADTSTGRSTPPTPASSVASTSRSGGWGSGGSVQVNSSGKVNPSRRVGVDVVELDHLVLEAEQRPRVDLEREVQVDRPAARLLGVQVDLPQLAQRVGLDEVPLVVHVEAVVDRVALQVGDEAGDVDDCHGAATLPSAAPRDDVDAGCAPASTRSPTPSPRRCATVDDWGPSGARATASTRSTSSPTRRPLAVLRRRRVSACCPRRAGWRSVAGRADAW